MSIFNSFEEDLTTDLTGSTTYVQPVSELPAYSLSHRACEAAGGHCYELDNPEFTTNTNIYICTCKHCGKKQHGTPQQDIRWEDA